MDDENKKKEIEKIYAAIDLKSFYASVECQIRGLNPLTTHLVVADESRTDKTICLAVSPLTKSTLGVGGRCRLFELRAAQQKYKYRTGKKLDIIIAPPQMGLYLKYSTEIYKRYLKFFRKEDIHVYSIDEVFIDITTYTKYYGKTAHELVKTVIQDILENTGITATAGIGANMYLAKIAMDIVAKHVPADSDGVRIAELDVDSYRNKLWEHTPLTDFWRIGAGTVARLERLGVYCLGDLALLSLQNPEILYKVFGIDAEILIDHAWGYEPVTIADIQSYKPQAKSINAGQVLQEPYDYEKTKIIVKEMCQSVAMDLLDKGLVSNTFVLHIGYDAVNIQQGYKGLVKTNYYGKTVPVSRHGTANVGSYTSSVKKITSSVVELFEKIYDKDLYSRRINLTAANLIKEGDNIQMDFFSMETEQDDEKEKKMNKAILNLQKRFGKNAILKGTDFQDGATTKERNKQIGGHKR